MSKPKVRKTAKRAPLKKPRVVKRKKVKPPSERVLRANRELLEDMATLIRPSFLGNELSARVAGIAAKREVPFWDVLREAVQHYVESEFVSPTTPAKDDALYPPTDNPLEAGVLPKLKPRCMRCGVATGVVLVSLKDLSSPLPTCRLYPGCVPLAMFEKVPRPPLPHPVVELIHRDEEGWWFWDETWAARSGPFPDEATARTELKNYCDYLDQPKPETAHA